MVIRGAPVGVQDAAAGAAVDEDPLALAADGDGNRLHRGAAVGGTIPRLLVDVAAPEAGRTVVAMLRTRRVAGNVGAAVHAAERRLWPVVRRTSATSGSRRACVGTSVGTSFGPSGASFTRGMAGTAQAVSPDR